jgi:hypothetical protein
VTTVAEDLDHGSLSAAKHHRCPCEKCREAERDYEKSRYRQMAYGTWQPFVDAQPARDHIRRLQAAGVGWQRVARAAGLQSSTVERLLYGRPAEGERPSSRIRPETAAKILAVRPGASLLADGARIDATGTHRRLEALAAVGYTSVYLAAQLGLAHTYISKLRQHRTVYLRTARAVTELYGRLAGVDPTSVGISPISAHRARLAAARAGWLPPQKWDGDIDDPKADPLAPDPLRCASSVLTHADKLAITRSMTLAGATAQQIADRTGVTTRTVVRWRTASGWKVAG